MTFPETVAQYFVDHAGELQALACHFGVFNEADREDVVQNAAYKVLRRLEKRKAPIEDLGAYVARAIRAAAFDHGRRVVLRQEMLLEAYKQGLPPGKEHYRTHVDTPDMYAEAREMLDNLTPKEQRVLKARLEGRPWSKMPRGWRQVWLRMQEKLVRQCQQPPSNGSV